ncbi:MAG: DUF1841 family protein [Gammaproteobacteria bacterium]
MFVEDRNESREFFLRVWRRMQAGEALEPLEQIIADVIAAHPEYHATLGAPAAAREAEFDGSDGRSNPFLHMGLHIALVEQLQTDRPPGIRAAYQALMMAAGGDTHTVEHRIIDCLAHELWQAGQEGRGPDALVYLDNVRRLAR